MDPLKDFISDCCVLSGTAWVAAADLRRAYEEYCRERGDQRPFSPHEFAEGLRARGCAPDRRHSGRCWVGIGLATANATADQP
jgi:phage/plasmid-associated DNA primase